MSDYKRDKDRDKKKSVQLGIVMVIASVFFILASCGFFEANLIMLEESFSGFIAYILIGIGAYLIGNNTI